MRIPNFQYISWYFRKNSIRPIHAASQVFCLYSEIFLYFKKNSTTPNTATPKHFTFKKITNLKSIQYTPHHLEVQLQDFSSITLLNLVFFHFSQILHNSKYHNSKTNFKILYAHLYFLFFIFQAWNRPKTFFNYW